MGIAYFLLSPAVMAIGARYMAGRCVNGFDLAGDPDRIRRCGRWFFAPWLLYGFNILAFGYYSAEFWDPLVLMVGLSVAGTILVILGFMPMLEIAVIMRSWLRTISHPTRTLRKDTHVRVWMVHVSFMIVLVVLLPRLGQSFGLLFMSIVAAAAILGYMYFYPNMFAWIWRVHPLRDGAIREQIDVLFGRGGIKVSEILVIPASQWNAMNAFASGILPMNRRLFVTEKLLECCTRDELGAILAHEIGHLRNNDVRRLFYRMLMVIGAIAGLFYVSYVFLPVDQYEAGTIALVNAVLGFCGGAMLLIIPRRAMRRYEYEADAFAAKLLGGPEALIRALRHIALENWIPMNRDRADSAFASHPGIRNRLARLDRMRDGLEAERPSIGTT